ncbi:dipeptide/oligopeptide/nickel ABC transporter permease/ATP-binding protein [Actinophytocola sp.]|uniref:dipeptide/oligopeptide/nickel ABC transporter permease/ATP-binding protein n=1 Tax=Actinophytocola sp. TaxID=1872138 RepID=UPI00389A036C
MTGRRVGLGIAALLGVLAVIQPVLAPANPYAADLPHRLAAPDWPSHLLGTDQLGRDVLSRVLAGFPWSLGISLVATIVGAAIGTLVGLLAGWRTGWSRAVLTRLIDLMIAFPYLVVAVVVVALAGHGFWPLALTLGLVTWPSYARVTYAETLSVRTRPYVLVARLTGAASARILVTHVLPALGATLRVLCALQFAEVIIAESGLSFLGLGAPLGTPTWGNMLADSRAHLVDAPWLLLGPGIAIVLAVTAANLVGTDSAIRGQVLPRRRTAGPGPSRAIGEPDDAAAITVRGLTVTFPGGTGPRPVVRDVSLCLRQGETLGLVGESGAGKTTLAMSLLGLVPPPGVVTGSVRVTGEEILGADERRLRSLRGARIAMVFQDPMMALNPVRTIGSLLVESIRRHQHLSRKDAQVQAIRTLRRVGMPAPEERVRAYPHTLSGGLRQRAVIALALANSPAVLVADEPTTALDATIQAQVLDVLREQASTTAIILITHDLGVAAQTCDSVAVVYAGRIVEIGPTASLLAIPRHPYTRGLLAARPHFATPRAPLHPIPGQPPAPGQEPPGCRFAPRCPVAETRCEGDEPALRAVGDVQVACVKAGDADG